MHDLHSLHGTYGIPPRRLLGRVSGCGLCVEVCVALGTACSLRAGGPGEDAQPSREQGRCCSCLHPCLPHTHSASHTHTPLAACPPSSPCRPTRCCARGRARCARCCSWCRHTRWAAATLPLPFGMFGSFSLEMCGRLGVAAPKGSLVSPPWPTADRSRWLPGRAERRAAALHVSCEAGPRPRLSANPSQFLRERLIESPRLRHRPPRDPFTTSGGYCTWRVRQIK